MYVLRWMSPLLIRSGLYSADGDRWYAHAVALPHGAQLCRVTEDHQISAVASFDADLQQWVAEPETDILRRALTA
jgi:hypothetical protein